MAKTTVTENTQRIPTADGGYSQSKSTTTTTEEARKLNTQSGMSTMDSIEQYYNSMKEPVNAQIEQAGNDYQAALDRLKAMKEQADAENYRSYVRQQNELPGLMRASGNNGGMVDSAVASLANAYNQARAKRGLEYEANAASQGLDYNNRLAELRAKLAQYDQMAGADRAELDAYLAEQERLAQAEAARQEEAQRQAEAAEAAAALNTYSSRAAARAAADAEEKAQNTIAPKNWGTGVNNNPTGRIAAGSSGTSAVNFANNDPARLQNVMYEYDGTPATTGKALPAAKTTPNYTSESGGSVVNSNDTARLRNIASTYDKGTTSTAAPKKPGLGSGKATGFTGKQLPSIKG